jgi:hypothetical protein
MSSGEGLEKSSEQSPWLRGNEPSIHQGPMERLSLGCWDPAKPRRETRRTRLDSELFYPVKGIRGLI